MSDVFDGEALAAVVFLAFVAVSLLLCGLAAADEDDPESFYAGGTALGPVGGGLAVAGDYVSAATLISTTGAVALNGTDGILFACASVASLALVMVVLARPLRHKGVYTLGDFLTARLADPSVRRALGIATLVVLVPLLVVQLTAAGQIMVSMFGLPEDLLGACTVGCGAMMICYSALGGMRGTGYIQILKTVILVGVVVVVAGMVLSRFGFSPFSLFSAARDGSGQSGAYAVPGLQFGDDLAGRLSLVGFLITLVLGPAFMPHITMRLHPMGPHSARRTAGWAVGPVAVICLCVVVIGLGAAALVGGKALRASDPLGNSSLLVITSALDPQPGGPRHSMLFAMVACAVFVTTLSTVAGITLASASSLARDFTERRRDGSRRSAKREVRFARWAIAAVGVLAVMLSTQAYGRNPQALMIFSFTAAASVLPPVLLTALSGRGITASGVRWAVYGTLPVVTVLLAFSPATSGSPIALLPDTDFHWFPMNSPALITVPLGFLLARLGSRDQRKSAVSRSNPNGSGSASGLPSGRVPS
ncbi:cation acetate symporter [Streptomyces sp. NPDC052013]|uniref:cation acetate symporter n=1 Tax=Streptomyces sp. NPDC052013 TaxID=3365679 RepID=UPI0037D919B8